MPRIRTIKPEFFQDGDLFDAEVETGLPMRVAFAGLWTQCDRRGRFRWKPRELKVAILPYDSVDFSRVLDAFATRGFVLRYEVDGQAYGAVRTFERHQVVNNREAESEIPPPPDIQVQESSRDPRVTDACNTRDPREDHAGSGERKGKERKGNTDLQSGTSADRPNASKSRKAKLKPPSRKDCIPDPKPEPPPSKARTLEEVAARLRKRQSVDLPPESDPVITGANVKPSTEPTNGKHGSFVPLADAIREVAE